MGSNAKRYCDAVDTLWNKGQLDQVTEFFAVDYHGHDALIDRLGPEGARASIEFFRERIKNVRYHVRHVAENGDWVAARWEVECNFHGPVFGLTGHGQAVTIKGMSTNRFRNGKVVEGFITTDLADLAKQLGQEPAASAVSKSDLFHVRLGGGRPLMLMHGGLGLDHTYFRPYLDPLEDQTELIYFDHRGNGRSPRPLDLTELNHDRWCDDAEELRRSLGRGKIVLLGHSYGGFLAQAFALRHPESVAALILSNTAPVLDYLDVVLANAQRRATAEQLPKVVAAFTKPAESDAYFRDLWKAILPIYFHRYEARFGETMDAAITYSAAGYTAGNLALASFNTTRTLGALKVPTLILAGADDWITPVAQGAQRLKALVPHADLVVFEQSGHFPFIEERDRYLQVVRDWLAKLSAA